MKKAKKKYIFVALVAVPEEYQGNRFEHQWTAPEYIEFLEQSGWHVTFSKEMSARIAMVYAECIRGKKTENETTDGMGDSAFFEKMKPGSLFINTARGELVDNDALIEALRSGKLAGAGIDTLSPEPVQADHVLLNLEPEIQDRVLITPHIGGISRKSFRLMQLNVLDAFEACANGKKPKNIVNGL